MRKGLEEEVNSYPGLVDSGREKIELIAMVTSES